jgi:hypothetical protein
MTTPRERLLAEDLPTGTFGHALPPRPTRRAARAWTPEEQAAHWAELCRAVGQPHLRVVSDDTGEAAA